MWIPASVLYLAAYAYMYISNIPLVLSRRPGLFPQRNFERFSVRVAVSYDSTFTNKHKSSIKLRERLRITALGLGVACGV